MDDPVEAFFAGYPPAVQAISRALRALVRAAAPDAYEILVARHNHIDYALTPAARDSVCYICPLSDYVRLGFYYGGRLADPAQRLEGTSQRMRHVKVRTLAEVDQPALRDLVLAAWAEAATHMGQQA